MDVHLAHGEPLPHLCAKCGGPPTVELQPQFTYFPWWQYVLIGIVFVVSIPLTLGVGALLVPLVLRRTMFLGERKKGNLKVPMCARCVDLGKSSTAMELVAVGVFLLLFLVVPFGMLLANDSHRVHLSIGYFAVPAISAPFVMIAIFRLKALSPVVWARRITTDGITLAGVHPDVVQAVRLAAERRAKEKLALIGP